MLYLNLLSRFLTGIHESGELLFEVLEESEVVFAPLLDALGKLVAVHGGDPQRRALPHRHIRRVFEPLSLLREHGRHRLEHGERLRARAFEVERVEHVLVLLERGGDAGAIEQEPLHFALFAGVGPERVQEREEVGGVDARATVGEGDELREPHERLPPTVGHKDGRPLRRARRAHVHQELPNILAHAHLGSVRTDERKIVLREAQILRERLWSFARLFDGHLFPLREREEPFL
mmetsp:Transcript_21027/g.68048  ORF Transcript_21027/g.68048 Transcript_21027/m.68048 type:complete len:234 (-) Transcript_21027:923-1624(-)